MSILMVTRPISPPWDEASKNFAYSIATAISKYKFHILTSQLNKEAYQPQIIQEKIYTSSTLSRYQQLLLVKYLWQNKCKAEIYHYFFTPTFITSSLLKYITKKNKKKSIQTIACLSKSDLEDPARIKKLLFADKIIVYSKHTLQKIKAVGINNVNTIYPGVDLKKFNPNINTSKLKEELKIRDEKIILYAGEYERLQAIDDIIKSLPLIIRNSPKTKFILACRLKSNQDKLIEQRIKKQIAQQNLSKKIIFLNTVTEMPALINLSHICILPAREMSGKFDLPLILIEALACAKPIIVTDIAPLNEIIQGNVGSKIQPGDYKSLANEINILLNNEAKYKNISKNCLRLAQDKFALTNIAKQYKNIYESIS